MKKITLLALMFLLGISSLSSADILQLKSGKIIRGKVMEETPYSVKFMSTKNEPFFYYRHEISKLIKEGEVPKEKKDGISEEKKDLIIKFLDTVNVRGNIDAALLEAGKQAPEKVRNDFSYLMDTDEIIELVIPIYADYYTQEELEVLISFFENPAVQKYLQLSSIIADTTAKVILKYVDKKIKTSM